VFSTSLPAIDPLLDVTCSEAPVLPDSKAADFISSGHLLKGFWVNFDYGCGFIGVEQWLWNKSKKFSGSSR
jgi:hypothetical protein